MSWVVPTTNEAEDPPGGLPKNTRDNATGQGGPRLHPGVRDENVDEYEGGNDQQVRHELGDNLNAKPKWLDGGDILKQGSPDNCRG